MLANARFGVVHVDVADDDDGHQLRAIPGFIEGAQLGDRGALDDAHVATDDVARDEARLLAKYDPPGLLVDAA